MTNEMPNEFIRPQGKMKQTEQNERKDLNGRASIVTWLNDFVIKAQCFFYASLRSRIDSK